MVAKLIGGIVAFLCGGSAALAVRLLTRRLSLQTYYTSLVRTLANAALCCGAYFAGKHLPCGEMSTLIGCVIGMTVVIGVFTVLELKEVRGNNPRE